MIPVPLSSYRRAIRLDEPFIAPEPHGWELALERLVDALGNCSLPSTDARLHVLHGRLATLEAHTLSPAQSTWADRVAAGVAATRGPAVAVDELATLESTNTRYPAAARTSLWVGDITRLAAGAIVNAANRYLLGCRQPHHACIDNAIHTRAGPRLRDDCDAIMKLQGSDERPGMAKITRAYALPSDFVLHTVGPQLRPGATPTRDERRQLASCYTACLDAAAAVDTVRTVAFCAISTGVFAYPKPDAARVALGAVAEWLALKPRRFDRVVFNLYSQGDADVYRAALRDWS